jgi:prolyl-tRNA synthetase
MEEEQQQQQQQQQPEQQEPSKSALKKAEKQLKAEKAKADKAAAKAANPIPVVGSGAKGKMADKEIIGITFKKNEQFAQYYQELVIKSELIEYYEISGFYILRPAAMHIWNVIRSWFQDKIEQLDVQEASFPMFLTSKSLEKEKEFLEGFSPELAWVTKAGDKDLEVPVAVRPTSEALMYPYYAKWIRSHRDLPLRLNQWNNVVRWETKQTTPFLRAREFLWQEGHTAHLTEQLAEEEVLHILDQYAGVYEELLAIPVVRGKKTEAEKFAGGHWTSTCEAYIPTNGRGIQGATSHALGQNFSKMFDITVEDPSNKGQKIHVWQNSWGLSTRVIGVMAMIHSDDKGLVLPPRVARLQAILIPVGITVKTTAEAREEHTKKVDELRATIKQAKIRVEVDTREGYTPGWRFADWEMKGVPLRLEFGPKDAANSVVTYARRDTGEKGTIPTAELASKVKDLLEEIQQNLYNKAKASYDSHRIQLTDWDAVLPALNSRNVVVIPFCEEPKCEEQIKEKTKGDDEPGPDGIRQPTMGMKSLCIPFDQPEGLVPGETKCLNPGCGKDAKSWVMFGRSY